MRKRKNGRQEQKRWIRLSKEGERFWTLELAVESGQKILHHAIDLGFFPSSLKEPMLCSDCSTEDAPKMMKTDMDMNWRCSKCGDRKTLRTALSEEEQKMWLDRMPLRKQLCAIWHLCNGESVDKTATLVSADSRPIYDIYKRLINVVNVIMTAENDTMQIGGKNVECEADEVALRCIHDKQDGEEGVWWIRYFGMAKRGSTKMYLFLLEDRFVKHAGQGGGGALSIRELIRALSFIRMSDLPNGSGTLFI